MDFSGQTEASECAFHAGDKEVCSNTEMIKAMHKFLTAMGQPIARTAKATVEQMKEATDCDSEVCIYRASPFVKQVGSSVVEARKELFKPVGPQKTDDLLSNFNIDEVLSQFAKKYPGFVHIPFQMRDFQARGTELATINLADEYRKGMKTFGCVLNTDWSTGRGYHWYCIFGDFTGNSPTLEYYNSSGNYALPETKKWLSATKYAVSRDIGKQVREVQVLNRAVQENDVDCGVYCLHYLWSRLEGFPYTVFSDPATAPTDELMKQARLHLFVS